MRMEVNEAYTHLRDYIATLPSQFEHDGETIFEGRNVIKKFQVGGDTIVVKRFRKPHLIQKIIYTFFRHGKARRAYANGGRLLHLGFSTPTNIAYIETHRHGLLEYGYYISGVDDAPPICIKLNDQEQFDTTMAADLAGMMAALHKKGVLHHDLNSTNVLYHALPDGHYTFSFIDINRMKFCEGYPPLDECMENMTRFTGRMDLFEFVARAYVNVRQLPPDMVETLLAVKRRHDERWVKRKRTARRLKSVFSWHSTQRS